MSQPSTLFQYIEHWARVRPDAGALFEMTDGGGLESITWSEYLETVRDVAKGLIALGLGKGDSVALVADNRKEWLFSQFGISAAGGLLAPIYTTNTTEQVAYIVRHSQARIAICDAAQQLDKYLAAQAEGLIDVEHFVTMDDVQSDDPRVISLRQLVAKGADQGSEELDARLAAVASDDPAMLIYTSGTTGVPKGAIYTHHGIDFMGQIALEAYPAIAERARTDGARMICYLPLCHAAEQGFTNFVALRVGVEITFCSDLTKIKDHLIAVRPQVFLGVPRVWEKFEAALAGVFSQATGLKGRLLSWARRTELRCFKESIARKETYQPLSRRLADKLVLSKIRTALGLDDLVLAVTGAAPISVSTLEFFASVGVLLHEGYGMTETTAFASAQPHGFPRFGTIGRALPGVDIRIADDGEILLRGDNMVTGYLHMPEESAELVVDGWVHTGDLGALDDGFLRITGRKKDLLITAGGKNVAPSELEGYLQGIPGVGQAVVVGDQKPYLCALLVLDQEALPDLAKAADVPLAAADEMAADQRIQKFFEERVEKDCNARVARFQTIKKFRVLPEAFSVEGGELTPTLKVKRNVVGEKHAELIEAMYASA